jgi:hypothetical protein
MAIVAPLHGVPPTHGIPPTRGAFLFDPPFNSLGIRLTDPSDGNILPRNYSYWPNINAHAGRDRMRVFVGTTLGPTWFEIDKCTYAITKQGFVVPPGHPLSTHTTEGWYWSERDPDILYVNDDYRLYRLVMPHFDLNSNTFRLVADASQLGWLGPVSLRQWHTSGDGRFHSATVKQIVPGPWPNTGTVVCDETRSPNFWLHYPKIGDLDESQIDRGRDWLMIKENTDGIDDEDNRIISMTTGAEHVILDRAGAGGHSDNGYGYMVAADNWQTLATWRVHYFDSAAVPAGLVVAETPWESQIIHVSHCNARPGPPASQKVVGSGTIPDIVTFALDGSKVINHIAPSMSAGSDYDNLPKANVDPPGEWAFWTRQAGGRYDAFMVKL